MCLFSNNSNKMKFFCKSFKNRPSNIGEAFKQFDIFGAKIPSFNIQGQTKVLTVTGGVFTALFSVVFITYALLKFTHLVSKKNPLIAEIRESNFYDYTTRVNLKEIGFKSAFTIEGYLD